MCIERRHGYRVLRTASSASPTMSGALKREQRRFSGAASPDPESVKPAWSSLAT